MAKSSADPDLLAAALRLKRGAVAAGRLDVAAKVDEAIALLAGDSTAGDSGAGAGNTVVKILDGLGF